MRNGTRSNHGRRFPVEILTREEVVSLINACSSESLTGIRNRALIVLLWRGGLRVSEALSLRPKDFDLNAGTVRVLRGKGRKARTVGLDPVALCHLQSWQESRKRKGMPQVAPFFCTLAGKAIATPYVRALLPRLGEKAGIQKRCHPHGLRHAHAAELMAEGIPANVIQKQLGHSNLAITSRYLDHIHPREVVMAMQRRQWPVRSGARK